MNGFGEKKDAALFDKREGGAAEDPAEKDGERAGREEGGENATAPACEQGGARARRPRRARQVALIALFVALTVVCGFIKIPMQPVAMSLLTLATALAGCFLTPGAAALSQVIYVAMGLLGIPVFTAGGGPGYVLQPSFGFLLTLPLMAAGISFAVRHDKFLPPKARFLWRHAASLFISLLQLLGGTFYYYLLFRYYMHSDLTLPAALMSCFVLFIPGAIIKSVVSVALFDILKKRLPLQA